MSNLELIAELQNAEAGYGYGAEPVLKGVNLRLERGTITGLLGRNGAGKTTLMRTLVGLIAPRVGEAQIFGEASYTSSSQARQRLGYVSQDATELGILKVREVVYAFSQFYPNWNQAQTDKRLTDWGLGAHGLNQLSSGQRQKVSILLGMGHNPDLLILDEPVSSLDPAARHDFMKDLVEKNIDQAQTVLLSSHITSDIERIASHIAIMRDGVIVLHAALDHLREFARLVTFDAEHATSSQELDGLLVRTGNQAWVYCKTDAALPYERGRSKFSLEGLFLAMTDSAAVLPLVAGEGA